MIAPLWPILIILALPLLACSIAGAIWLHREWREAMDCFALAFGGVPVSTPTPEARHD